ncbi:MAG: hypothetical protein KatS3mg115_2259 [Candidatus Poribacteria bacterium]|nr:MAG: hypothetical protein KatS3mg115_2259 [Candidatus Poribacteria bacterium]
MRYRRLWALVLLVGIVPTAAAERWWVLLDRPPTSTLESRLETAGARVHRVSRWLNAYSVEADPLARERIAQLPFVRELRPVARYRRTVVRPELSLSAPAQETTDRLAPYRQAIQADRLQSWGLDGTGVRIGVLDSGFRLEHRALQSVQVVAAWDFVHGDAIVSDEPGQDDPLEDAHGTQVLGVLAADWDRAYRGVAPAAEYVLAKTEDVSQNGRVVEQVVEEDNWVAGLEWCAELGCEVVNSSLGYPMGYAFADLDGATAITSRAVAEAARRGVLVVVAAGNWDPQVPAESGLRGRIYPPADAPDALAVGAVSLDGRRWPQSAQGPTADGRIKPDLMAPGVGGTDPLTEQPGGLHLRKRNLPFRPASCWGGGAAPPELSHCTDGDDRRRPAPDGHPVGGAQPPDGLRNRSGGSGLPVARPSVPAGSRSAGGDGPARALGRPQTPGTPAEKGEREIDERCERRRRAWADCYC